MNLRSAWSRAARATEGDPASKNQKEIKTKMKKREKEEFECFRVETMIRQKGPTLIARALGHIEFFPHFLPPKDIG